MPRRRTSQLPIHVQIAQIDHSKYPPRPIEDDMMSIITAQNEEPEPDDDIVSEDEEEANRPEEFSPRLWQLFNRIQRRGTEPLFPADWQVVLLFHSLIQLDFLNIPPSLFHPPVSEFTATRSIISSLGTYKGSEFRGKQVFEKLTLLGTVVRNRLELNREMERQPSTMTRFLPVEPLIHADCERFLKWAEKDGSGGRGISVLKKADKTTPI
jgi:hypothetical protein